MPSNITTGFVNQFKANLYFGAQQKGSRLRSGVRVESQNGLTAFYDGLGPTVANLLVSRHSDTQYVDSNFLRRAVSLHDYTWADLIDNADKLRMLNDPTSAYARNAQFALGRSIDDEIIAAALGNARTGVDGTTNTPLPASQWVGAVSTQNATGALGTPPVTPGVLSNLNLETLIRVKSKFGVNDVDMDGPLHIAVTQSQIDSLLSDVKVTSADYANVKALVNGEINTFMGFEFHRLQRLPTSGSGGFVATIGLTAPMGAVTLSTGNGNNLRRCFAWQQDGLLLALGQDMETKIDLMPNKNYSTQVFARMSVGAARMLEEKVVGILCSES